MNSTKAEARRYLAKAEEHLRRLKTGLPLTAEQRSGNYLERIDAYIWKLVNGGIVNESKFHKNVRRRTYRWAVREGGIPAEIVSNETRVKYRVLYLKAAIVTWV